jgi:O-antigen ligase
MVLNYLKKFDEKDFFSYLIYLFPLLFLFGAGVVNSALVIISLYGAYIVFFIKKKINVLEKKLYLFFIIFFIYLFINTLINKNYYSLKNTVVFLHLIFITEVIIFLLENNRLDIQKLVRFFTSILLIVVLDTYLQYFTGKNILGYEVEPNNKIRLSSFFKNKWVVGAYLSKIFFPIFIIVYITVKKKRLNFLFYVFFILYGSIIILSGERASFLIFCTNLFLTFVFINIKKIRKILLISFVIFSSIVLLLFFFNTKMHNRYIKETVQSTMSINKNFSNNIFNNQYGAIFLAANIIWKQNFYFGGGIDNYTIQSCNKQYEKISKEVSSHSNHHKFICSTHPHNYILELLVNSGVLGLLFFLSFLSCVCFILFRIESYNFISKAFGIAFLSQFFPFMTHGSIFASWNSNFIVLSFALFYSYFYFSKKTF